MDHNSDKPKKIGESLQRIPFFSGLASDVLAAIAAKLRHERHHHGEIVFVEGSLGDSLYLIESGQVRISIGSGSEEKIINYLGPGNFFGEMALLLNQRRSANVTVVIDADFWVLRKADLDELLEEHPVIAIQISRELSRRLTTTLKQPTREEIYNLIAVIGREPWQLATSLAQLTHERIVLFDLTETSILERISEPLPEEVVVLDAMPGLSGEELAESLGILVDAYDRVLLGISPEKSESGVKALQLAEIIVLIDVGQRPWMAEQSRKPVWHIVNTPQELRRTARHLAQRVVGLALSSGGARGIAHVGVLRVLEREGIPVDMIAGTSAGSLFGGLYASGYPIDEVARFALNIQNKMKFRSGLWDINLRTGLLQGRRTRNYLEQIFRGITFEELKIPLYVVAADLMTGEEVVYETGSVTDAVRASISMVGIFSPHQFDGRHLIDGGAVNPLPVSVLAEKGADIIIGSRVIPSLDEERESGQAYRSQQKLNMLGVITNFQSIMEREIIKTRLSPVDVLIHPQVGVYSAMDYHQAADLIRLGEEAAEREIDSIKHKVFIEG